MESRILGDGYVRFGGECRETFYSNIEIGARCLAYFLTTSHDGFGSIMAAFTPVRIICNNTLNAAMNNCSHSIKIRHTSSAKERLETAHQLMGITSKLSGQLQDVFERWSRVRITDPQVMDLIQQALAPNREVLQNLQNYKYEVLSEQFFKICDAAFNYSMQAPSQQGTSVKGTLFGAYNGITGYFQNVRTYKNEEAKLKSLLLGGMAQQRAQKAFGLCEQFCRSGNINQLN